MTLRSNGKDPMPVVAADAIGCSLNLDVGGDEREPPLQGDISGQRDGIGAAAGRAAAACGIAIGGSDGIRQAASRVYCQFPWQRCIVVAVGSGVLVAVGSGVLVASAVAACVAVAGG